MSLPVLHIEHLSKSFGGIRALHDLHFTVRENEIFSIIGPNGAGKSTIFNCINGLYSPENGKIILQGKDITGKSPNVIAGQGIARTFQNLELFKYMSTIDNLLLGRHMLMKSSIFHILHVTVALHERSDRRPLNE